MNLACPFKNSGHVTALQTKQPSRLINCVYRRFGTLRSNIKLNYEFNIVFFYTCIHVIISQARSIRWQGGGGSPLTPNFVSQQTNCKSIKWERCYVPVSVYPPRVFNVEGHGASCSMARIRLNYTASSSARTNQKGDACLKDLQMLRKKLNKNGHLNQHAQI